MTYKQKHLTMLMVASAALTMSTGCQKQPKEISEKEKAGLLDDTPLKVQDKYGALVTVYLADVPLYNRDGTRQKGSYMLTRALSKEDFANYQSTNNMRLQQVCFNNSNDAVFVMTDENGAIQTTRGYAGLFADKHQATIVAVQNVKEFVSEINQHDEARRNVIKTQRETATTTEKLPEDGMHADSISFTPDTITWEDSLKVAHSHHLAQDTVQPMKADTIYHKIKEHESR